MQAREQEQEMFVSWRGQEFHGERQWKERQGRYGDGNNQPENAKQLEGWGECIRRPTNELEDQHYEIDSLLSKSESKESIGN